MIFNSKQIIFIGVFALLGLLALQVPLVNIAGSKASFTLFDSFAPIASGFIGTLPGLVAVFLMQFINFLMNGALILDVGTIIRFIPMLFAALYFAKPRKINIVVPILAIIVFNFHPIGHSVWYYSLYWLIPVICYFWQDKFVFARALGATFMAHAVGGAIWIWVFNLPKIVWIGLIPVVAIERLTFAMAMSLVYVIVKKSIKHYELKKGEVHAFYKN